MDNEVERLKKSIEFYKEKIVEYQQKGKDSIPLIETCIAYINKLESLQEHKLVDDHLDELEGIV